MNEQTGRTMLSARWIVGHAEGRHTLVHRGEIVFERGQVIFVGHGFPGVVARRIDYGEALIAPGMIDLDALSDLDTTVFSYDNHPEWKKGRTWPQSYMDRGPYEMYSPDELAFQKRYAFARLIRNGITTALPIASLYYREWGETYAEFAAAAAAAEDLGMRVYLGPAYRTGNPVVADNGAVSLFFDEERGLQGLADAVRFCKDFEGKAFGRVRTMLAPDRIETCTETLLSQTALAGSELAVPVRLHCNQGRFERDTVRHLHGKTSVEWLDGLGFLNRRTLLPHGTYVSPSRNMDEAGHDLDIIRDRGSVIVHCPLVAARHGDALATFSSFRGKDIRLALGTDTAPPDMVLNMQVGMLVNRVLDRSVTTVRSEDYFDAATVGGADALGRPDLGRLQPGARADIVVFDLSTPDVGPVIDPIQTLMLTGSGRDVRSVFIDGRPVMENRIIPGVDFDAYGRQAQRQFDAMTAKYPDRTVHHPPISEIFSSAYPLIESHSPVSGYAKIRHDTC
ncbi:amidohydrolase family protein [Shinella sp.]|uniref:amidohydrolase family protein n=1 Tax=Shinella sp. TaxID=1870904 RepID=UPI0029ABC396|nr:amidohydrolase family protein [Shinella sp.]MDX3974162.1 amidohydrolase family protein [Shinella sp.]